MENPLRLRTPRPIREKKGRDIKGKVKKQNSNKIQTKKQKAKISFGDEKFPSQQTTLQDPLQCSSNFGCCGEVQCLPKVFPGIVSYGPINAGTNSITGGFLTGTSLSISGDAVVEILEVIGTSTLDGDVTVTGVLNAETVNCATLNVSGNLTFPNLDITDISTDTLEVSGTASISSLTVTNSLIVQSGTTTTVSLTSAGITATTLTLTAQPQLTSDSTGIPFILTSSTTSTTLPIWTAHTVTGISLTTSTATVASAGFYSVTVAVSALYTATSATATGYALYYIQVGSSPTIFYSGQSFWPAASSPQPAIISLTWSVHCIVNDTITVQAINETGFNITFADTNSRITILKLF